MVKNVITEEMLEDMDFDDIISTYRKKSTTGFGSSNFIDFWIDLRYVDPKLIEEKTKEVYHTVQGLDKDSLCLTDEIEDKIVEYLETEDIATKAEMNEVAWDFAYNAIKNYLKETNSVFENNYLITDVVGEWLDNEYLSSWNMYIWVKNTSVIAKCLTCI